jgi:hypothetical protein
MVPTAAEDIAQMRDQIQRYGSITQFGQSISSITGDADDPRQDSGIAYKTDGGFEGFNGKWQVGNWGDTLEFEATNSSESDLEE